MVEKMSGSGGSNSRASNALLIRAEAIKKWKSSDTAKEKSIRTEEQFTIQFDNGTVFLSAVASGDLDETEKLLDEGVDIDFRNNDGLTALHQACIDENDDMVNLLLKRGANIEAIDNEGWTPLHAAASAGNIDIAQILVDGGANLAAVNNEGEVPLDLAEEEEMEDFLSDEIDKQELDVEEARNEEEQLMIDDATSWLNKKSVEEELNWQGATALHVAASKGYNKVISLILQVGSIDVNVRDIDGWTPLHAAVHWGSKTACELLTDAGADFELKNSNGQTPCDLAEPDFVKVAENCRKRSKEVTKKGTLKKRVDITVDLNENSVFSKVLSAIELLKTDPRLPAIKGGRAKHKSGNANNSKPVDNNIEKEDSSSEDEPPAQIKTNVSLKYNTAEVDNSVNKSSVRVSRLGSNRDNDTTSKDNKPETVVATFGKSGVGVGISRLNRSAEKEPDSPKSSRFQLPGRTTGRLGNLENNKPEEKKVEEGRTSLPNRYTRVTTTSKEEKDDDTVANRFRYRSKLDDDNRTRKKDDENESNEPETKRLTSSRTDDTPTTTSERRGRTEEEGTTRPSIADRLRKKNEELIASNSSDRALTERTSITDSYTNRSRGDRNSASSGVSSIRDRAPNRVSTTTSSDTGDTKDIQRKLDQALKDVDDYKAKYDKIKKEKEDLEKQLEQFKEDVDKMQELKNDNIRLKDENGALIRVISKLSRTPTTTSSS